MINELNLAHSFFFISKRIYHRVVLEILVSLFKNKFPKLFTIFDRTVLVLAKWAVDFSTATKKLVRFFLRSNYLRSLLIFAKIAKYHLIFHIILPKSLNCLKVITNLIDFSSKGLFTAFAFTFKHKWIFIFLNHFFDPLLSTSWLMIATTGPSFRFHFLVSSRTTFTIIPLKLIQNIQRRWVLAYGYLRNTTKYLITDLWSIKSLWSFILQHFTNNILKG